MVVVRAISCTSWLLVNLTSAISALGMVALQVSKRRSGVMFSGMGVSLLVMIRDMSHLVREIGKAGVQLGEGVAAFLETTLVQVCPGGTRVVVADSAAAAGAGAGGG